MSLSEIRVRKSYVFNRRVQYIPREARRSGKRPKENFLNTKSEAQQISGGNW